MLDIDIYVAASEGPRLLLLLEFWAHDWALTELTSCCEIVF